jgi:hypothetical protein
VVDQWLEFFNLVLCYSVNAIYIYIVYCIRCWILMSWLSKLIVVNNFGCPKYNRNSAEILVKFFTKKNYPQIKSICWDLLALIQSYNRVRYSTWSPPCLSDTSGIDIFAWRDTESSRSLIDSSLSEYTDVAGTWEEVSAKGSQSGSLS